MEKDSRDSGEALVIGDNAVSAAAYAAKTSAIEGEWPTDLVRVTGSLRTTDANGLNPNSAITDTTGTDMKDAVSATGYAVMATGLEEMEGADGGGRGSVDMRRC